jgi:hypothetical protein
MYINVGMQCNILYYIKLYGTQKSAVFNFFQKKIDGSAAQSVVVVQFAVDHVCQNTLNSETKSEKYSDSLCGEATFALVTTFSQVLNVAPKV